MKINILILMMFLTISSSGQADHWPFPEKPPESVVAEGVTLPVYDFAGLKPMLEPQNKTLYVLNFWATWCKPCVEEMPHFIRLAEELKEQNIQFIFVNLDFRKNLEKGVIPFVKEKGIADKVIVLSDPDANSWIGQVDPTWSGAIPATLVYRGDERKFHEGVLNYEELKVIIHSFLN